MKFLGRGLRADPDLASGGGPIDSQRHEGRDRVPWDNGISLTRWTHFDPVSRILVRPWGVP